MSLTGFWGVFFCSAILMKVFVSPCANVPPHKSPWTLFCRGIVTASWPPKVIMTCLKKYQSVFFSPYSRLITCASRPFSKADTVLEKGLAMWEYFIPDLLDKHCSQTSWFSNQALVVSYILRALSALQVNYHHSIKICSFYVTDLFVTTCKPKIWGYSKNKFYIFPLNLIPAHQRGGNMSTISSFKLLRLLSVECISS